MFVVTPSGVSLEMTPEGVTTNVLAVLFFGVSIAKFTGNGMAELPDESLWRQEGDRTLSLRESIRHPPLIHRNLTPRVKPVSSRLRFSLFSMD